PTWWATPGERARLAGMACEFLSVKVFDPVQGLVITARHRHLVAAQACFPLLGLDLSHYDNWTSLILYPDTFIPDNVPLYEPLDAAGAVVRPGPHSGLSLPNGPVLLSWADVELDLATREGYAVNVILHEMAHQLDVRSGGFDGMPRLHPGMSERAWIRDFTRAFRDMVALVDDDHPEPPLDPYAADSPAEFFAVAVEAFFITPDWLLEDYPEVYGHLCDYFRQDPVARMDAMAGEDPRWDSPRPQDH
ncbi:MAG: M90 family metallopeptidase, partial [Magnetococcus sp. WYHC-3]